MQYTPHRALVIGCALLAILANAVGSQDSNPSDMAAIMERAQKFTQPGEHHAFLRRFLGSWDTELRFAMEGMNMPPETGSAEFSWLMEGRWLQQETEGTMFGKPTRWYSIIGYDNMKMSYVVTSVSSMDTAMNRAEGDLDPSGNSSITYGTIDEYLTGEHDKMVKTVWRFVSEDEMLMEVHDLPMGERKTKVVEVASTRRK